jgi:3-hydroxyethyl bacteriochlorophyllide a dehydrogenase
MFQGAMHPSASPSTLSTHAVVLLQPERIELQRLALDPPGDADVVVDMEWSGISTGTERLLWSGHMPAFPGMGYPLVPGYEGTGRVVASGPPHAALLGRRVFVPGARCFGAVRGLFGSAASRVVVPGARVTPVDDGLGERAILLALAATAQHALASARELPQLIVGHGALGRLLARLIVARGGVPTVWEIQAARRGGAWGYRVVDPSEDGRHDYRSICDVSGDAAMLNRLLGVLAPRGEIVLAGFYSTSLAFEFPAAFMREARLSVAAQWQPEDLQQVCALTASGALPLDGLITHTAPAAHAPDAYRVAFNDPQCLKMCLDWRKCA